MSKYRITFEGKTYEMDVELICEGGTVIPDNKKVESTSHVITPTASSKLAQPEINSGCIVAPMPGTVIKIVKTVGDEVKAGELVLVLEAMKMENEILSPSSGVISAINSTSGGTVNGGDILFVVK